MSTVVVVMIVLVVDKAFDTLSSFLFLFVSANNTYLVQTSLKTAVVLLGFGVT